MTRFLPIVAIAPIVWAGIGTLLYEYTADNAFKRELHLTHVKYEYEMFQMKTRFRIL